MEASDTKTSKKIAIKIIKNHKAFAKQAQSEIHILDYLHSSSGGDANHIGNTDQTSACSQYAVCSEIAR